MAFFTAYMRQRWKIIALFILFGGIFLSAFWLYDLPVAAVLYPAAVCMVLGLVCLILDIQKNSSKHRILQRLAGLPSSVMDDFPTAETLAEQDYQEIREAMNQTIPECGNTLAAIL